MNRPRDLHAIAIAFVLAVLYFASLPMTLTEGDSGEWVLIAKYGGIPHPSGYPLYAILIRLIVWLIPWFPVVTNLALVSAICAASAAILTYCALVRLADDRIAAACSVLTVFTAAVVWRMANMPEPFALNILLGSGVLYVFTRFLTQGFSKPFTPLFLMGLIFGLGFCNHHSLVWLLPMPAVVLFASGRKHIIRNFGLAVVGLITGLLPLAYFLYARNEVSPYDFYTINDFREFIRLLLRSDYGSFALTPHKTPSNWASVGYFYGHLPQWFSWVFLLLVLAGFVAVFKSLKPSLEGDRKRIGFLSMGWGLSFLGSGFVFLRLFNVHIESIIPSIIERFMALPVWLLVVPLFFGTTTLFTWIRTRFPSVHWLPVTLFAICAVHISLQYCYADRSQAFLFENHTKTIYEMAKMSQSAVVSASDPEDFAVQYGTYILGLNSAEFRSLMLSHWGKPRYITKMSAQMGWDPREASSWHLAEVVKRLLDDNQRVLVLDVPKDPKPKLFEHSYIFGPAIVLLRSDLTLPSDDELMNVNEALWKNSVTLPFDCDEVKFLSSWDYDIYLKYYDGLVGLKTKFTSSNRQDLVHRVDEIFSRVCRPVGALPRN